MTTDPADTDDRPADRAARPRAAMVPRRGTTVLFHHLPDGTVTAASRGLTGAGRTVGEALADLEWRLKAASPDA